MEKILIIEDDKDIVEMLELYLKSEGYSIVVANDGIEGLQKFRKEEPKLVILDIMMPRMDGIEVVKTIRESSNIPVIFLSAKGSDVDKAIGLGFGADDYLSKPFSMIELLARVKANIRRATIYSDNREIKKIYNTHDITIDLENYTVIKDDENINLTMKEFEILKLFIENPNKVFSKSNLYRSIWKEEYYGDENVLNVHIKRLRNKIEKDPKNPVIIKTIWGIGYKYDRN